MNEITSVWFKLLTLFEQANHLVKEGDWFEEDKKVFYSLKDTFLDLLIKQGSEQLRINLLYVPYFKYSTITKDKAGDLMRSDYNKMPFEYYLSKIEPCDLDIEIPEKATVEMEVICENRQFCFHIPLNKTTGWNIDYETLSKKIWLSSKEFHRNQMKSIKNEINELMNEINNKYA
jgi:hypothetical protein